MLATKKKASRGAATKKVAPKTSAAKPAVKAAVKPLAKRAKLEPKRAKLEPKREAPKAEKPDPERDKARKLALGVASVGLEHSALNVEIIDVRGKVDYADYVVVMSGRSDRQVSALARHIEGELEKKLGERCLGVEGLPTASWLLMDFGDVVVHIFHEDTRGYYDLETLWLDAARVPTPALRPE
jgi:ribosome-associated protein